MAEADPRVEHNEAAKQYEVRVDGALALLQYERDGDRMICTHTEVPDALEGRGIGSLLAKTALDDAREGHLRVVPRCPFVRVYIERHPEYAPLVDPEYARRGRRDT